MNYTKIGLWCLLTALFCACGGNGNNSEPEPDPLDRKPMLTHWVDNIIIPSFENYKPVFDVMASKSEAFAADPTTVTLGALRAAWVDAYIGWQKVELFEVGPADRYTLRGFFNIYPADVEGITANMNDASVNLALPASYARQGFPALDYLINGVADTDDAIVTLYTTDADAAKRVAYLQRIIDRMNTLLTNVLTEWKGTARDTYISKTGLDVNSSTGIMVNTYVLHYERYIRSGKFGIPSGAMTNSGGTKYPDKVEAYYKKDISLTLAKTAHQAAMDFFHGKNVTTGADGPSFKSYLDALDAKDKVSGTALSTTISDQFNTVNARLNVLSNNLSQEVETRNDLMIDVYAEMQRAVRLLKADMTSAMSVTITYTDNDGD